jgi:uroporphyrinogen-III synthase
MPLRGRTIAITRPMEQCASLAAAIQANGGIPLVAPLIAITRIEGNTALENASNELPTFDFAIFISPNSVEHSLPTLLRGQPWPTNLRAAAIGPGTQKSLAKHRIQHCLLPEDLRYDSEGLLDRPEFQAPSIRSKSVLLLRGDGGRELLAETLIKRGAKVTVISCYRRTPPTDLAQPLETAWEENRLDGLLLSSSESLANLLAALSPAAQVQLSSTPIFVPHPRIAEKAISAGLHKIIITPPAEEGLLNGLLTYNWDSL